MIDDGEYVLGPASAAVQAKLALNSAASTAKAFAASMTFDLSVALHWVVSQITSDFAVTLANGADGNEFTIALCQSVAGGNILTGLTVSGRTLLMRNDITQLNTTAFKVAGSTNLLVGRYETVNAVPVVILDMVSAIPAAIGNESFYSRVNAVLGSQQLETWDLALGVTVVSNGVDAWVGQKNGVTLPAVTLGSGPVYLASDPAFGGKPSVTGSSGKALRKTGLSAFMASGSKPYIWAVARMPAPIVGGTTNMLIDYGVAAVSDDAKIYSAGTAGTSDIHYSVNSNTSVDAISTVIPATAMLIESWVDAANIVHLAFNGVDVGSHSSNTTIGHNISEIGVFSAASSAAQYGTFAMAAHGCCAAVPSTTQRAALLAAARNSYGI